MLSTRDTVDEFRNIAYRNFFRFILIDILLILRPLFQGTLSPEARHREKMPTASGVLLLLHTEHVYLDLSAAANLSDTLVHTDLAIFLRHRTSGRGVTWISRRFSSAELIFCCPISSWAAMLYLICSWSPFLSEKMVTLEIVPCLGNQSVDVIWK
ncbi:hypothetical protein H2248_007012 [Termitomyces sp. 'cryptogamus']|nr:hypothetical protein H2248_007012 [Termitomyces sp. 'cryptogamus']